MRGRAYAYLNLALRFVGQVLWRIPLRSLRRGRDAARFRAAVRAEGYLPLSPAHRAGFPATMGCIHCGLCTLACPALRDAPAGIAAEPWSFVGGASRALDRAGAVAADLPPCARCDVCAAVCPTGVPIPRLAAWIQELAAAEAGDATRG